jgi:hypothetical protein
MRLKKYTKHIFAGSLLFQNITVNFLGRVFNACRVKI